METTKKKILVFIDWFLPGYKAGGPVRSMANMVDHLSDRFEFYIITRNTEYLETTPYPNIKSNCWVDFKPGVKVYYASSNCEGLGLWRKLLRDGSFDTVYINGIYSLKYSILPLVAAKKLKIQHIIISPRGMLASSAIDVKSGKKNLFLKFVRLFNLYKDVNWHATNEKEALEIKKLCGSSTPITIAANMPRKKDQLLSTIDKKEGVLKICSFARISPEKNTLFALQTLLNVQPVGEVTFHLYGQIYNPDYWQECLAVIQQLPPHVHVEYKGVVDAELVGERMADYHVMFLPSRGENFGHVILESLMTARPVLISDQTPWLQLQDKLAGWDLSLDHINQFTSIINDLIQMDQSAYNHWQEGASQLASQFVNDPALIQQYIQLFK